MLKSIKCHCGGRPSCKLCGGTSKYEYDLGPRGYLPFACPTCRARGYLEEPGLERENCFTCRGNGTVDPADPPSNSFVDIIWKAMFGA